MLSNSQVETFKKKGFLVIRNFFHSDIMSNILNEVNRLDALDPIENGPMKYYEKSLLGDDEMLLIRIEKFIETSPILKSVVYNQKMVEIICTLLEDQPTLLKEKLTTNHMDHRQIIYIKILRQDGINMAQSLFQL